MTHSLKRAFAVLFATLTMTAGAFAADLSIQQQFAQLQLEASKLAEQKAAETIQQIRQIQQKQQDANNAYIRLHDLQSKQKLGQDATLPDDLRAFLDENNLPYGEADAPDYATAISAVSDYIDSLANGSETQMVYIQDYMAQYNQYLQSSTETMQSASDMLSSLSNNQASLFSTDGAGAGAPVVVSALGGVVIGMVLMWGIDKRRSKKGQQE